MAPQNKTALLKRFESMWKLEWANIILIGGIILFLFLIGKLKPTIFIIVSFFMTAIFLWIGGHFWKDKYLSLRDNTPISDARLKWYKWQELWKWGLLIPPIVMAVELYLNPILTAEFWVGLGFWALAIAEWINYYHRQLMHFDNPADFKRLISGRGLRQSHLSRELERLKP